MLNRRHKNSGRQHKGKRSPSHLKWIRGHDCAVSNKDCKGKIEAAHVRRGTDGGSGVKPSDKWTIPLCGYHHQQQHREGEITFEVMHGIDLKEIAEKAFNRSPYRRDFETSND